MPKVRGGVLDDVLGFEDTFWSLGLEASSPRKLPCPRLEDSTIFWTVEILMENAWNLAENLRRPFFVLSGDRQKKVFWRPFSPEKNFLNLFFWNRLKKLIEDLFFGEHLHLCPWSLALASRGSVLGLGLEIFLCPWPWPRALCPRLHLCPKYQSWLWLKPFH